MQSIRLGENTIFGAELGASFDVYGLFGARPYPGTRWRLDLDYLSNRGPSAGTRFDYSAPKFFGLPAMVTNTFQATGMSDQGLDNLGGGRGNPQSYPQDNHPTDRGRVYDQLNVQNLPEGFTVQAQAQLEREGVLRQRRLGQLGTVDSVGVTESDGEDDEPEEKTKEKE